MDGINWQALKAWATSATNYLLPIAVTTLALATADAQEYYVADSVFAGNVTQKVAVNSFTNRVYVAALGDNSVYVIDGSTNTVMTSIPVGVWPRSVAVDLATNRIYVGNSESASVSVIDGFSNTVIDTIPVGSGPGVDLNPFTNRLYVTHFNDNTVSVVDVNTNTVLDTVSVGSFPAGTAVNPIANTIYVSNRFEDTVSVIDGVSNTVTETIPVGFYPGDPDYDPMTNRWYLPIRYGGIWVFDAADNSLITIIEPGGEYVSVEVDPFKNLIFAIDYANYTVTVIDGDSFQVVDDVPIGDKVSGGLAINPWTNRAYVAHEGEETLSIIRQRSPEIAIDIKPGNKRNVINPRANGGIWVAILSDTNADSSFDPLSQVDVPTVEFGPDGAKALRYEVKDKNKDGLADLMLRFKIPETGIACGDTEATLKGSTFGGQEIAGTDSIKTVGCPSVKAIRIQAHIDGRSQLILRRNKAQWHHFDFAAPGRHEFRNEPTVINGIPWFPVWPDVPDAENRFCDCLSDVFKPLKPKLSKTGVNVDLDLVRSRGRTEILQYPSKENRYTLIIEFDDNAFGGSDDYLVEVRVF